ncbi:hypothetical protein, partial [Klebsiella pneumoniae]|uniref:hypothetical protein n=1 Tax=Klebsiella pneumoniae TaxID=573 RepID=UPI003EBBC7B5
GEKQKEENRILKRIRDEEMDADENTAEDNLMKLRKRNKTRMNYISSESFHSLQYLTDEETQADNGAAGNIKEPQKGKDVTQQIEEGTNEKNKTKNENTKLRIRRRYHDMELFHNIFEKNENWTRFWSVESETPLI